MDFSKLNRNELLAVVGLVKQIMVADATVSHNERNKLQLITVYIGEDKYRSLLEDINRYYEKEEKFRELLQSIKRQEVRELIYGTVFEIASADALDSSETDILDWLAKEWDITVEWK